MLKDRPKPVEPTETAELGVVGERDEREGLLAAALGRFEAGEALAPLLADLLAGAAIDEVRSVAAPPVAALRHAMRCYRIAIPLVRPELRTAIEALHDADQLLLDAISGADHVASVENAHALFAAAPLARAVRVAEVEALALTAFSRGRFGFGFARKTSEWQAARSAFGWT